MKSIQFAAVNNTNSNINVLANRPKAEWKSYTDGELIELVRAGQDFAASLLYYRYYDQVRNFVQTQVTAYRGCFELADDIASKTFLDVFNGIKSGAYTEKGKFMSYLRTSAKRKVLDYAKSSHTRNTVVKDFDNRVEENNVGKHASDDQYDDADDAFEFDNEDSDYAIVRENRMRIVEKVMPNLPPEQLDVLRARVPNLDQDAEDVDKNPELSFNEICEKFGIGINTATSRYHYAIKNLRKMIGEAI